MATVKVKLRELETRVGWLERAVREMRDSRPATPAREEGTKSVSERERLLAKLKAEGLIRDLTSQEQAHAERWRTLPKTEKRAVIQELQNLKPGPMLSDIIIQNRR